MKKNNWLQHCIRAIAGEVVNSKSVHSINLGGGGLAFALKSATALILEPLYPILKTEKPKR